MRFSTSLSVVALTTLITACSGAGAGITTTPGSALNNASGGPGLVSLVPSWLHPAAGVQLLKLDFVYPAKASGALYGSEFESEGSGEGQINAYPNPDPKNAKPTCTIEGYAINGWGVDNAGDLILPSGTSISTEPVVNVYKGPKPCGTLLGSITDSTGQPATAASFNATKDKIYVGEIASTANSTGEIVICTLKSKACGAPITNAAITGHGAGVAIDSKGDCWMSAATATNAGFLLVYWKGCKGKGVVATGTKNTSFGGLFFDTKGNLVSVDVGGSSGTGVLHVYKGCTPKCTVVGTMPMKGASLFGNLNAAGTELAVGDIGNSQIDVYKYTPTKLTYMYSFNNDLNGTGFIIGGGFNPTNKQL